MMGMKLAALAGFVFDDRGDDLHSRGAGKVRAFLFCVVPTDMSSFAKTDAGREFTLGIQALKRMAQPDDIGAAIVFLASDEARWITGDTLRVDGGSKL